MTVSMRYQDLLLEEFRARKMRNAHYSLRAFARDIDMPASKLSQNLRGLCGISRGKGEQIADKLQMRDDEKQLFLALIESQHARSRVARQQAEGALQKIREEKIDELSLEKFATIRDWYHMAILEMTEIQGFRSDPAWMADKLGLPVSLIQEAIRRLQALDLLTLDKSELRQTHKDLELGGEAPSRTIREHHKQILTKAMVSLDSIDPEKREYASMTVSIDSRNLPELKKQLRSFQKKMARLSGDGKKDSVYVLSFQLFPLVTLESKGRT